VPTDGRLRIGELSRRSGVSPELLRAWERRYGLLRPERSAGGLRLYAAADVERVRLMREHLAEGFAAAEAAELALAAPPPPPAPPIMSPAVLREELAYALDRFDEPAAHAILDRLLAATTLDTLLGEVVMPYLRALGERWERCGASVAQEHFASTLLRGRLLGLARGWGRGPSSPTAVLACLPGEQHDLGLIAFGLALRSRGWRIVYLGPDAPIETVDEACREVQPSLVVLHAVTAERVAPVSEQLRALARRHRVALGGAAAHSPDLASQSVLPLTGDVIAAAARITELVAQPTR